MHHTGFKLFKIVRHTKHTIYVIKHFHLSILYFSIFNYFFFIFSLISCLILNFFLSKTNVSRNLFGLLSERNLSYISRNNLPVETSSDNTIDTKSHGLFKDTLLQCKQVFVKKNKLHKNSFNLTDYAHKYNSPPTPS